MRLRVIAMLPLLLALAGWLASGCGHAADPESSLTHTRAELAHARSQVRSYAESMAGAVERARLPLHTRAAVGSYRSCGLGKGFVTYSETLTITADVPATMTEISQEIAGLLRAEGWSLVSVDFAKVHLGLADTDHPLYRMSQHGAKGAANIIPYQGDSAGALIFMSAPCIDASSLAAQIERTGQL